MECQARIEAAIVAAKSEAKNGTYKLVFSFDKKIYSTLLKFGKEDVSNDCIQIKYTIKTGSKISSNSPEKKCFNPILISNLPKDVKQTDILQVLSTKLKFIVVERPVRKLPKGATVTARGNPANEMDLLDMAQLKHHVAGLSAWRLLHEMPTLYEKYGYVSEDYTMIRETLASLTWDEIKNETIFPDVTKEDMVKYDLHDPITIDTLLAKFYPGIYSEIKKDMLVTTVMKDITYDDSECSGLNVDEGREDGDHDSKRTLIDFVINVIYRKSGKDGECQPNIMTVSKNSEVWKEWDNRLQFMSFEEYIGEPGAAAGGAGTGFVGGRSRRTLRLFRHRRSKRRFTSKRT